MRPGLKAELRTVPRQQMLPKMVIAGEMMAMNLTELEQKMQTVIEDNPALDFNEDGGLCFFCGFRLERRQERCPNCGRSFEPGRRNEVPLEEVPSARQMRQWKDLLQEEIESFVHLAAEEINLFRLVIINLDRDGFLRVSLDQLASTAREPERRLQTLIDRIRAAGFSGFASRDAVEFLVIQLKELGVIDQDRHQEQVRGEMVRNPQGFEKLVESVRDRLSFSPAQMFVSSLGRERDVVARDEEYVRWDAEIWENEEGEFEVTLLSSPLLGVNLNQQFVLVYTQQGDELTEKDRLYCQEKLREAKEVVSCLSYRHRLFLAVLQYIISQEQDYFKRGFRYYVPLKQRDIAQELGVSNSGICQIMKNKSLRFPDGSVRPIKFFFDTSYPVKEMIRLLLTREDPRHPLSDREIQQELTRHNVSLSRRSVALYRETMGVLPSYLRKRMHGSPRGSGGER